MEEHYAAGSGSGAQIGWYEEEGLERSGDRHLFLQCLSLCDTRLNRQYLSRDLLFSGVGINLAYELEALLPLVVVHQLARALWAREEKEPEQDGWYQTQAHHVSPAVRDVLESCVEGICEDRTSAEEDHIDGDHPSAKTSERDLANIHGYDPFKVKKSVS